MTARCLPPDADPGELSTLRVWRVVDRSLLRTVPLRDEVRSVKLSFDGQRLLLVSRHREQQVLAVD